MFVLERMNKLALQRLSYHWCLCTKKKPGILKKVVDDFMDHGSVNEKDKWGKEGSKRGTEGRNDATSQ